MENVDYSKLKVVQLKEKQKKGGYLKKKTKKKKKKKKKFEKFSLMFVVLVLVFGVFVVLSLRFAV